MFDNITAYSSQRLDYNFKGEPQKKFDPKRKYFIADKKKRIKAYTLAGIATAITMPILYNNELKTKPAYETMKAFNKKFSMLATAVILPLLVLIFLQERANYLYNKQNKINNDTFIKNSKGV